MSGVEIEYRRRKLFPPQKNYWEKQYSQSTDESIDTEPGKRFTCKYKHLGTVIVAQRHEIIHVRFIPRRGPFSKLVMLYNLQFASVKDNKTHYSFILDPNRRSLTLANISPFAREQITIRFQEQHKLGATPSE